MGKCFGKGMRWMEEFHDGQTKRKKFLNEQTFSSLFTGKFFTRSPKKKKKNENHFILHTITFLGLHCGVFFFENATSLSFKLPFLLLSITATNGKCVSVPSQEKMENPCQ